MSEYVRGKLFEEVMKPVSTKTVERPEIAGGTHPVEKHAKKRGKHYTDTW